MKYVSVLGDSISTYQGFNPNGYAVYYDQRRNRQNGLKNVYDTWWAKVNQALHAYLCVNNSFSGSRVTGLVFPAATDNRRIHGLKTESRSPNIILIYLGLNDFGFGAELQRRRSLGSSPWDRTAFEDAYDLLLRKLKKQYPKAVIACATLMRTTKREHSGWVFPETFAVYPLESYNEIIREAALRNRCLLADLSATGRRYETLDGFHPTANGHRTIAECWLPFLNRLM